MWTSEPELSLEGIGIAAAPAPTRRRRVRAGVALGWLRERLTTTPGRLVLTAALVIVGATAFGVLATGAEQSRERAVRAARTNTEPLLVHALNLYTELSDANATVATGLLGVSGLEPALSRIRYLHDLQVATEAITALAPEAGTSPAASDAIRTVANQLPIYTGLIETARADNQQGFPIGAAYLRQAATLLKTSILPAAESLYAIEAERLNNDYETGTASASLVALAVAIAVALGLLVLAQVYLTRISHRVLNVLTVVATVALVGVSAWAIIGLTSEQNSLASAQHEGSDSVEALSTANILLSRAQGDLSLTLVNRGTDTTDPRDFTAAMKALTTTGLADGLGAGIASYDAAATSVRNLENRGGLVPAIQQARAVAGTSHQLGDELTDRINVAQTRFVRDARDAASALSGLGLAIPLITALIALLALLGLRQRINEYR